MTNKELEAEVRELKELISQLQARVSYLELEAVVNNPLPSHPSYDYDPDYD